MCSSFPPYSSLLSPLLFLLLSLSLKFQLPVYLVPSKLHNPTTPPNCVLLFQKLGTKVCWILKSEVRKWRCREENNSTKCRQVLHYALSQRIQSCPFQQQDKQASWAVPVDLLIWGVINCLDLIYVVNNSSLPQCLTTRSTGSWDLRTLNTWNIRRISLFLHYFSWPAILTQEVNSL